MTFAEWDYMGPEPQLFRRTMAEALADLLGQRYRTAKQLARGVGIDVKTAENLRAGHLSVTTLQKVLRAEGRGLWDRLGDELFGETFFQFEERRLSAILNEAEDARSNLVRLRARREELLASALDLDEALAGPTPGDERREAGGTRSPDDRGSDRQAPRDERGDRALGEPARSFAPENRGRRS